jgi:hypothetical protein
MTVGLEILLLALAAVLGSPSPAALPAPHRGFASLFEASGTSVYAYGGEQTIGISVAPDPHLVHHTSGGVSRRRPGGVAHSDAVRRRTPPTANESSRQESISLARSERPTSFAETRQAVVTSGPVSLERLPSLKGGQANRLCTTCRTSRPIRR